MKKILFFIFLLFVSIPAFAEEQTQQIDDNKAVISIQKQPQTEQNNQKQNVKRNWFCIVIQINGKVLDTTKAK